MLINLDLEALVEMDGVILRKGSDFLYSASLVIKGVESMHCIREKGKKKGQGFH